MKPGTLEDAALELIWSAWTELGVPGVQRKHRKVAVDPEPLILFTPTLASNDPRLMEQATAWCEAQGEVISKTRLDGLARSAPKVVSSTFGHFSAGLGGAASSWGAQKAKSGRPVRAAVRSAPMGPPPLERPALARVRMRSLSGTGARADVLCELLGAGRGWTSATDLEFLGYSRRYIAGVLAELTAAGLTTERSGTGPASFRLRNPQHLSTLVDADTLTWPNWRAVLSLAVHLMDLEKALTRSPALAPIKARDAWDELHRLSLASGVLEPPRPSGERAGQDLLDWGSTELRRWPLDLPLASHDSRRASAR